jgi:hypothetical protein
MHHYKKIVEKYEDKDEEKEEDFSWLSIVLVVLFIIFSLVIGRVLYKSFKKKDNSYDKLINPKSREDCFELISGKMTSNKNCLNTWGLKNMKPEELMTQYGAVRDPVQL